MNRRTLEITDNLARKVSIVASKFYMSDAAFIRAAITAAAEECADRDPILRRMFETVDESEGVPRLNLRYDMQPYL